MYSKNRIFNLRLALCPFQRVHPLLGMSAIGDSTVYCGPFFHIELMYCGPFSILIGYIVDPFSY